MATTTRVPPTWTSEDDYWREAARTRPYWTDPSDYDEWRPAYRYGFDAAVRYWGRAWDDNLERELHEDWDGLPDRDQRTAWEKVRDAVRDAWDRVTVTK